MVLQSPLPANADVDIADLLAQQRTFFETGQTRSRAFRLEQLNRLKAAVVSHQDQLLAALATDLGKPELEAYSTEIGVVGEITHAIKQLKTWMKPQRVTVPLIAQPGRAEIIPEPLGVALIISPWNYPVQLAISPLVGAIAAGNCAIVKPSEIAPATSAAIAQLINDTFDPAYIAAVEGGVETSQALLEQRFDHIFFTGSTHIGRVVMAAAAKHLTPVTLELGGKSPCIVSADANLDVAARRIAWGKFINAGQTCVAPDYLLVDRGIKAELLAKIGQCITEFYGDNPAESPDFGRIVSDRHWQRLHNLIQGDVIIGGQTEASDRYIAPTVIDQASLDHPAMADEIFGPILPVLDFGNLNEAIAIINQQPKPLALYVFSDSKATQNEILQRTSSGGVTCNDTILHIGVPGLPFGGVGNSGMGTYHGKASFDAFTHYKSVLRRPFWSDFKWRYAPYAGKLDLIKKLLG